jgi:diguanylate cyclase (GGDEF)-like protein/putative nucleotidyltransferase with HDIG domain
MLRAPLPDRQSRFGAVRHAAIERMTDSDVRWRSLGALFVAAGGVSLLTLLVPTAAGTGVAAIALVAALAVVSGLTMIALAARLPRRDAWVSATLAFGTVLISLVVIANHSVASPYALIYVWVGFDAFFFFHGRTAWGHLVFAAVAYAVALVLGGERGQDEVGRWLMTIGTVGAIGTLAYLLKERSTRLIAQLSDVAQTDALTGLLNRRGFEERIGHELSRMRRTGGSVSLIIGDLDHFKTVNDRFGHHRGDEALQRFSEIAQSTTRGIDGAARIGGEEFALVLPDTDEHGAYLLAERLRRRVRDGLSEFGSALSVSFGVATFPRHADDADDLLRCADQALYLAKRLGRDRSVIFSSEVSESLRHAPDATVAAVEQLPAVLILAETLDLRDTGTALHSQTVGRYAEAIATAIGLPPERVERVRLAGLLHDIGKIGVADPILRKAGPLTEEEWAEMKKHPELGARILAGANLDDISGWVLSHHERPDGSGYPAGLSLEDVPLEARILSVADAFEAMTSDRVYREALPTEAAVKELRRHAGTQFDLEVVETFLECLARGTVGPAASTIA